ncbi:hypothetical protein K1719_046200 [Acacia pycnantha]|nr:hypothetical protein K1719_046200 [Acacia pycnantha]
MAAGEEKHSRKWRYTWEAQSHIPTLRLLLFAKNANPSSQCLNLKVQLLPSQSLVAVSWFEPAQVSLRVPIPRVLVDFESPVSFRALDDHIEVKLLLLLPVDHPILSSFDSVMNLSDDPVNALPDVSKPLVMGSDVKDLSSGAAIHFYCRSCSFKLTRNPLRRFVEMPSVNWREVADNWFGASCCSFGGISEKLVIKYANSYTYKSEEGINKAAINSVISMERSSTCSEIGKTIYNSDESSRFPDAENENLLVNLGPEVGRKRSNHYDLSRSYPDSNVPADVALTPSCCAHMTSSVKSEEGINKAAINSVISMERSSTCSEIGKTIYNSDESSRFPDAENENLLVNLGPEVGRKRSNHDDLSRSYPDSNVPADVALTPSCCAHMTSSVKSEEGINKAAINSVISMERSSTCSEIGKTIYNSDESSRFPDAENENLLVNLGPEVGRKRSNHDDLSRSYPDSNVPADVALTPSCCAHMTSSVCILENEDWHHHYCENARKEHRDTTAMEILASQKSFLNGFLEDIFMARSSNLSEDIDWCEFTCPQCKSVLGAYPCCKGDAPVDGGVRLFKCNISTCLPARGSGDLFRQYTMEKNVCAKANRVRKNDESSFRISLKDDRGMDKKKTLPKGLCLSYLQR